MKAERNKKTGKLKVIVSHWANPKVDEKANRQFAVELRKSGDKVESLKQVSDRKYVDTRPSINEK